MVAILVRKLPVDDAPLNGWDGRRRRHVSDHDGGCWLMIRRALVYTTLDVNAGGIGQWFGPIWWVILTLRHVSDHDGGIK